jgi:PAC2 family
VSELVWEREPRARRPVLVTAFAGYFDAASASTAAVDWLVAQHDANPLARIDGDAFFDFQQLRPQVVLEDGVTRTVVWPENVVHVTDRGDGARDLVLLSGVEPYVRWRDFCGLVLEVAERSGCELVVTLGATPAQVPHTRMPPVFGSSTNAALAARLGLSRPQYQGITGVVGVLQFAVDEIELPSIAMRVGVPHYAMAAHNPKATMTLLRHLEHVTGVSTAHGKLGPDVARWEDRLSAAVADDAEARAYVSQLEARYDTETEQQVSAGEDLADELERFLREQRGDS